jgi:hypothetical protein
VAYVFESARDQVIGSDDIETIRYQGVAEMRSEKPRSTRYQRTF